jgi:hypothetical protein
MSMAKIAILLIANQYNIFAITQVSQLLQNGLTANPI